MARPVPTRPAQLLIAALAVVAVGIASLSLARWSWPPPERPVEREPVVRDGNSTSLVLVVIDTVRADHMGAWGYPLDTTPNLDALAARGTRFDRFYSTCSWTRPAMASLLTGLYPRSVGVYEEESDRLDSAWRTVAQRLDERGYTTVGLTSNANINAYYGFDQGFDVYSDSSGVDPEHPSASPMNRFGMEPGDVVTERTLALVDEHITGTDPFYLQVLYVDPHHPYAGPGEAVDAMRAAGSATPDYDADLAFADAQVQALLDGLEGRGLLEDTVVVVTSDHGEGLLSHQDVEKSLYHGTHLYESVVHVPLIVWQSERPPRVVDTLTSGIDLLPTLLDLLDLPDEPSLPGQSLVPLMEGRPAEQREHVFFETDWRVNEKVGVRTATHKLVRNDDCKAFQEEGSFEGRVLSDSDRLMLTQVPPLELYALGSSSEESPVRSEVAARYPERVKELEEALADWEARTPRLAPINRSMDDVTTLGDGTIVGHGTASGYQPPSEEEQEALKALGYLAEPPERIRSERPRVRPGRTRRAEPEPPSP